jgi:hypothetical protein
MPLLSTKALPLDVSAVFAGAICANAIELAQITAAAAPAKNILEIIKRSLLAVTRNRTPAVRAYSALCGYPSSNAQEISSA